MKSIFFSNLSFFNTLQCHYHGGQIVDHTAFARPFNIIGFLHHGEAIFNGSSGKIHISPGDCFFIPFGETYVSEWFGQGDLYITCIFFYFDYNYNPLKGKKYHLQKIENKEPDKIENLFIQIYKSIHDPLVFPAMQYFYTICTHIFSRLYCKEIPKQESPVHHALLYLHDNFSEEISIRKLAELCYLSESRFMHVFKEQTGMSAITYKNNLAIHHASRLLQSYPQMSIEEISEACGFSSAIYFRRVFKEITGVSPRECRKKNAI